MLGVRNGLTGEPKTRDLRSAALDIVRARLERTLFTEGEAIEYLWCAGMSWKEATEAVAKIVKEHAHVDRQQ